MSWPVVPKLFCTSPLPKPRRSPLSSLRYFYINFCFFFFGLLPREVLRVTIDNIVIPCSSVSILQHRDIIIHIHKVVHQPVDGSATIRPYYIKPTYYMLCYTVLRRASVSGKNLRNMVAHLLLSTVYAYTRAIRLQYIIIIIILFKNTQCSSCRRTCRQGWSKGANGTWNCSNTGLAARQTGSSHSKQNNIIIL